MQAFIAWYLAHINYLTIFLLMTIESSFIPFPSEVVVPPAAYLAAQGELDGTLVLLVSTLGALCGAVINYCLALWLGRPLVHAFVRSRLGRILLLSEEKLVRAEHYFDRKGAVSTLIGRLLPGIRQLISIPAGLARMRLLPFISYTALGAGVWNVILYILGYSVSKIPGIETKEQLIEKVTIYSHQISVVILILFHLVVVPMVLMKVYKKRKNRKQIIVQSKDDTSTT
ncbi:membrane protein DedA, SNARE-associated domain [Porphyromonas circumdentaria]|uniref:Membrane protein DedA, SNARE-associated domain n=2 Tax=Porphyromonas circumdentaria TaxID=29524 RepID=A0A1T4PKJ4_9PORP|nr:DedA family protein [Porphyromonas circumdentaria]MBB6276422.1 membrane protein DedA with SNARE-associated domain [Porphyromonas circumdentaria]SJZ92093.1 membrane protein DedA, SNARE-associated domain [Porphyromonas circumdentaria]